MSVSKPCRDRDFRKIDDDLLGELERFIHSTRLVIQPGRDRIWLKVWPEVGFCVHPGNRLLLPAGTSLRNPLRPEQAWSAFLRLAGDSDAPPNLQKLKPRPLAVTVADLTDPGHNLRDDVALDLYATTGDRRAQAEAILFRHLSVSLQELNHRIVLALGIESWAEPVEALLRDLGLATDLDAAVYGRLISTMSGQWDQISAYVNAAMDSAPPTSGPAMLYLIAMCSACAVSLEQQDEPSITSGGQNWVGSMLDRTQPDPHARLLRAIADMGHRKSVVRIAARLGGQRVRILAERSAVKRALKNCIQGLKRLDGVGEAISPTFLADIEFSRTHWRTWPNKVLRLAVARATTTRGTVDYQKLLMEELPCVEEAMKSHQLDPDRLPANVRWRGLLSVATDLTAINHSWESALPAYCDHGYEVSPLLSSAALWEEGEKMKHCVARYDWECEVGISQIYSICDCSTGAHIATVHIRQGNRKREWQLTQVNGPGNQPVSLLIQDIASSITSLYNLNEC